MHCLLHVLVMSVKKIIVYETFTTEFTNTFFGKLRLGEFKENTILVIFSFIMTRLTLRDKNKGFFVLTQLKSNGEMTAF